MSIAANRLKSLIERIEKLEEERRAIGADVRDVYSEAKGVGFNPKIMRKLVAERRSDAAERDEQEALLDTYRHALNAAVELVRNGLSLREAGRVAGVSKSSIHRALAVPAVSQATNDAIPQGAYSPETKSLAQSGGDERVSSADTCDLTIPAHLKREKAA